MRPKGDQRDGKRGCSQWYFEVILATAGKRHGSHGGKRERKICQRSHFDVFFFPFRSRTRCYLMSSVLSGELSDLRKRQREREAGRKRERGREGILKNGKGKETVREKEERIHLFQVDGKITKWRKVSEKLSVRTQKGSNG